MNDSTSTPKEETSITQECRKVLMFCVSPRTFKIIAEITAVVLAFLILFIGTFLWKIYQAPIEVNFLKPAILKATNTEGAKYSVNFDKMVLAWTKFEGPIRLRAIDLSLNSADNTILALDQVDIYIDTKALLRGTIAADEVILHNPRAHVMRDINNNFSIDIASDQDTDTELAEEAAQDTDFAQDLIKMLTQTESEAIKTNNNFGYIDRLEIRNAEIIISDHVTNMTWFLPKIDAALNRWTKGLNANVNIDLAPYTEESENILTTEFTLERNAETIEAKINIRKFDLSILSRYIKELKPFRQHRAQLDGRFVATFDTRLNLDNAVLDISLPKIDIDLPEEYGEVKSAENIVISGFYDALESRFQLDLTSLNLENTLFKGKIIGTIDDQLYNVNAELGTETLPLEFFTSYWPKSLDDENAADWLKQKLSKGQFEEVLGKVDITYNADSEKLDVQDFRLDFGFSNMDIDYRSPMIPISDAVGSGFMDMDKIELAVAEAKVDDMSLTNGRVLLDDIFISGAGIADIALNLKGDLPDVFEFISREPISLGDRLDFKPNEAKGKADIDISLNFPTIRDLLAEQVKVNLDATITDGYIPRAVKDLALTGGPFKLVYDSESLKLEGKGKILNRPLDLKWTRYIDESKHKPYSIMNASLNADRTLREAFDINLDDYIDGTPKVDLTYKEYKNNRATIDTKIDLTLATFFIKPFDYEKPAKKIGHAALRINLKNDQIQNIKKLNITVDDAKVSNASLQFGKVGKKWDVVSGEFNNAQIEKNKLNLTFKQETASKIRIDVDAEYLDLLPFLSFGGNSTPKASNKENASSPASQNGSDMEIFATTRILNTSKDGGFIEDARSYIKLAPNDVVEQLELDAISGGEAVYLRYKPTGLDQELQFRLEADNAGTFLEAFGLYDNVLGGKVIVFGNAKKHGHPNDVEGIALIEDFMVVNAPTLARLLSAMSLTGVEDLLTQDGINFDRLESKIKWIVTEQGITFSFDKGRTSGGALGLTFEGNVYQGKRDEINIQGTIVPISFLNRMISKIPLLGNILTGGENQGVFAATYKISGTSEKADVSINPLSVLAPGIIRRILFQSDDIEDIDTERTNDNE